MAVITILVSSCGRGRFDARLPDSAQFLIEGSRMPFCDAARALLSAGLAAPSDRLIMRYVGSEHDALRASVAVAAKLTVREETADGKPRFVPWTPHPSPSPRVQGASPTRLMTEEAPGQPPSEDASV
jgi:hypothetical protein